MRNFTSINNFSIRRSLFAAAFAGAACLAPAQSMQLLETITDANDSTLNTMALAISPNHRYLAGSAMNYDTGMMGVFIYDTETETATYVPQDGFMSNRIVAVNDEGFACGNNDYPMTVGPDGVMTKLPQPDEYSSTVNDMTADGSVIVGYYANFSNPDDFNSHACIWKDNELVNLPEPTADEMGGMVNGSEAQYISADGSVIAGVVNDANYMPCATIWRLQDDGTYAYDLFYQKYFSMDGSAAENTYSSIRPKGLSANGKYLSLTLMDALGQYVARYDVEQGTLDAFIPDGTNGMEAGTVMESSAIADDGKMACLIFSGTGMMQQQTAGVWENNGEAPYELAEKYPELTELADFANGGYPQLNDITPDGRYIAGYAYSNGIDYCSFIIDLGEGTNGIKAITNGDGNSAETARYTIDGKRITAPVKGLNIIKKADGSAVKVIVK